MVKVIITGASGFVGSNLLHYLEGNRVEVQSANLREVDWKLKFDTQGVQSIIHLAGKAHDTKNTANPEEYFKINRDLTKEVFDLFLNSDVQDFFFFSSVKAVADTVEGVLEEDVIASPSTPYGKSKLEAEKFLLSQFLPPNKRLFIIRPCMIHGPGNKGNLNLLYKVVKSGFFWPLASFTNSRSFLSIENLNYLVQAMIDNHTVPTGVYNFADDKSLSTNDVIRTMAEVLGSKPRFWKIPPQIIVRIAAVGDKIRYSPLNSERLKKLTESYEVSNNKIKLALHMDSLPVSSHDGLRRTIASFGR